MRDLPPQGYMERHTPTPWKVETGRVVTAAGIPIARMDREPGNGTLPVERDDNARFIVEACNHYYGGVSAEAAAEDNKAGVRTLQAEIYHLITETQKEIFNPQTPKPVARRLQQLINHASVVLQEVHAK